MISALFRNLYTKAFTLVEMMIVIAILTMGMVTTGYFIHNSNVDQERAIRFANQVYDMIRDTRQGMIIGRGYLTGESLANQSYQPVTQRTIFFEGKNKIRCTYMPIDSDTSVEEQVFETPFIEADPLYKILSFQVSDGAFDLDWNLEGEWKEVEKMEFQFLQNGEIHTKSEPNVLQKNIRSWRIVVGYKGFNRQIVGDALTGNIEIQKNKVEILPPSSEVDVSDIEVTFDVNGGTPVPSVQKIKSGTIPAPVINPTKENATFVGWYKESDFTHFYGFDVPLKENTLLYAKWDTQNVTLKFNTHGGSAVADMLYTSGEIPEKPANPTKENAKFADWYSDNTFTSVFNFDFPLQNDTTIHAKWDTQNVTLKFNTNGGSSIPDKVYASGNIPEKPGDPTKNNNDFGGWYRDSAFTSVFNFDLPLQDDTTIYAKWTITVSFDTDGGNPLPPPQIIPSGSTPMMPPEPKKGGYTFDGWYIATEDDPSVVTTTKYTFSALDKNTNLIAKWKEPEYTVEFVMNISTGVTVIPKQTVKYNALPIEPQEIKENIEFEGWYTDKDFEDTKKYIFNVALNKDTLLYAKWNITPYILDFDLHGGEGAWIEQQTFISSFIPKEPTPNPTKENNDFGGWYMDPALIQQYTFSIPIETTQTLHAKWIPRTYTLIFNPNGGTLNGPESEVYTQGTAPSIPPNPSASTGGDTFNGWYLEPTLITKYDFSPREVPETTLYAKWGGNKQYFVTFDAQGGYPEPEAQTIDYGSAPLPPSEDPEKEYKDYSFEGWFDLVYSGDIPYDFQRPLDQNTILVAKWNLGRYNVHFDTNGGSTIPMQSIQKQDAPFEPEEDPTKSGYIFAGWYEDSGLTKPFNFNNTYSEDITIYAKWKNDNTTPEPIIRFSVTFDSDGGSYVEPQSVQVGEAATKPENPTKANYIFEGWYRGNSLFNFNSPIISNIRLKARWK